MFRSRSNGLSLAAIGAVLLLTVWHSRSASCAVPEGIWMFANRVAVQLFDCGGQLCGRIVWLLRPRTPAGQPDLDTHNPETSLRQRHLCGLTIIWGLQPGAPDRWTGGWLYDPQDGATYDVTAELASPTTISARVYRGAPLFGRTEILIRDPQLSFDGRC
jgi:uncharacterized protein (DUF2147 family)